MRTKAIRSLKNAFYARLPDFEYIANHMVQKGQKFLEEVMRQHARTIEGFQKFVDEEMNDQTIPEHTEIIVQKGPSYADFKD